jgi:hypothetical protein
VITGGCRTQLGYAAVIAFYSALWLFGWIETIWCMAMIPMMMMMMMMLLLLRAERQAEAARARDLAVAQQPTTGVACLTDPDRRTSSARADPGVTLGRSVQLTGNLPCRLDIGGRHMLDEPALVVSAFSSTLTVSAAASDVGTPAIVHQHCQRRRDGETEE